MEEEIICQECEIQFTRKKNLYAHLRRVHNQNPIAPKTIKEICDLCGKQFVNKSNFSHHMKKFHQIISSNEEQNRRSRIKCYECSEHFKNHECLRKHITSVHKEEIEYNEFYFESSSGFHQWKDQIQERSLSCYVLDRAPAILSDGSKKQYYNCHRSHNYTPKGKGLRAIKSKGTNKINKTCPSRMEVVSEDSEGPVLVKFWMTHLGHSLDIDRIFLSKTIRTEIAGKLKEGVSYEHILDSIHDGGLTNEESQRIMLLKKKDLHNIARDFRIDYSTKHHQNEAISNKLWVEDMKKLGDECPVLLYEEQGVECDLGILDSNDFVDSDIESTRGVEDIPQINKSCQLQNVKKAADIKRRSELIIGLCDRISHTDEEHTSILNSLDKVINILIKKRKAVHLKTELKINTNEKIEKQGHLFSTKKRKTT